MPFLTSEHEARHAPLLVMARGGDHNKRPWSEGPSHGGRQPPCHRARMDTGPDWALFSNRWGSDPHQRLFGLAFHDDADHRLLVGVSFLLQERRRCWR
jgi:hypothetical protein